MADSPQPSTSIPAPSGSKLPTGKRPPLRHSPRTRAKVIKEFRRTGRVDLACACAGVERTAHYDWLKRFPDYAAEIEAAREEVAGLLEDEAIRRAYRGTQRPMNIGGQLFMVTEMSDRLLEFLLKCRNRPIFGDVQALTGANGLPLIPERAVTDEAIAAYKASKLKSE